MGERGEAAGRYAAGGEQVIERTLGGDELCAGRDGLALHRFIKVMDAVFLVGAELQTRGELKHVQRTWLAVEFRAKRQAHAAPSLQIGELPLAQGLDVACVETGISRVFMLMLGRGGPSEG
ncbi:MAG TPA: hypothetical protein VFR00_08910 [Hyphomicrobiaceae bacterium]|nr:hypothetical protein [Hyphomicrobiaceae bacterium]